ncbi:MAG: helix-turn-helix domain-containing protein [Solirubrobacteraceae bacterium]
MKHPELDLSQRENHTGVPGNGALAIEMVRVLEADPGLAGTLPAAELERARALAVAPIVHFGRGIHHRLVGDEVTRGHLGLLVLDGLIARHLCFGEIAAPELLGPGDLLRPWPRLAATQERTETRWEMLTGTRMAFLNHEFAARIAPWPELAAALLDRVAQRADSQVLLAALRQARRVDNRLLLALWYLAGRWGAPEGAGRRLSIQRITGETLARMVGGRRQSVSTAMGHLADRGAIRRNRDGTVTIAAPPPELAPLAVPAESR